MDLSQLWSDPWYCQIWLLWKYTSIIGILRQQRYWLIKWMKRKCFRKASAKGETLTEVHWNAEGDSLGNLSCPDAPLLPAFFHRIKAYCIMKGNWWQRNDGESSVLITVKVAGGGWCPVNFQGTDEWFVRQRYSNWYFSFVDKQRQSIRECFNGVQRYYCQIYS